MGRVEGKVAVVTGAASGIGRATARRLAAEGARVGLADVDQAGGEGVAAQIREAGGDAFFRRTDVRSLPTWRRSSGRPPTATAGST